MRRKLGIISALSILLGGITAPAHATIDGNGNGSVSCSLAGAVTITNFEVIDDEFSPSTPCEGSVDIPEGVTSIGDEAFGDNSDLTGVTLPSTLVSIGYYAFGYTALSTVIIPERVQALGEAAFEGVSTLTSITLPTTLTAIPDYAFYEAGFNSITIPDSVRRIGDSAFAYSDLAAITLSSNLERIDARAFEGTTNLNSITLPNSLVFLGDYAFEGSGILQIDIPASVVTLGIPGDVGLTAINVEEGNLTYASKDGVLFSASFSELITYPQARTSVSYEVPAPVVSISTNAFQRASSLTSLTFETGSALRSIANFAFYNLSSLATVILPSGLQTIGESAFGQSQYSTRPSSKVVIPASVITIKQSAFRYRQGDIYFLGNAPSIASYAFQAKTGEQLKAYISPSASGFGSSVTGTGNSTTSVSSNSPNILDASYVSSSGVVTWYSGFMRDGALDAVPPTPPAREGFNFAGWSVVDGGPVVTLPYTPSAYSDLTLFPNWSEIVVPPPPVTTTEENSEPVPKYSGPIVTAPQGIVTSGSSLTLSGSKLELVISAHVGDVRVEFDLTTSSNSITLYLPAEMKPGSYDLVLNSSFGKLTVLSAVVVSSPQADQANNTSASLLTPFARKLISKTRTLPNSAEADGALSEKQSAWLKDSLKGSGLTKIVCTGVIMESMSMQQKIQVKKLAKSTCQRAAEYLGESSVSYQTKVTSNSAYVRKVMVTFKG